jgi:hypothetical protein
MLHALIVSLLLADASPMPAPAGQPAASAASFRAAWSADTCVQQRGQTWDDYWRWVQRFYNDKDGWNAQSEMLVAKIADPATRAKRAAELQALGVRVSAEWSKTNACRKIRTTTGIFNLGERGKPALSTWGEELRAAARRDSGDGSALGAAIDDLMRRVDALLGPAR